MIEQQLGKQKSHPYMNSKYFHSPLKLFSNPYQMAMAIPRNSEGRI